MLNACSELLWAQHYSCPYGAALQVHRTVLFVKVWATPDPTLQSYEKPTRWQEYMRLPHLGLAAPLPSLAILNFNFMCVAAPSNPSHPFSTSPNRCMPLPAPPCLPHPSHTIPISRTSACQISCAAPHCADRTARRRTHRHCVVHCSSLPYSLPTPIPCTPLLRSMQHWRRPKARKAGHAATLSWHF